jgi:DNA-3-methyladenine glycosylase
MGGVGVTEVRGHAADQAAGTLAQWRDATRRGVVPREFFNRPAPAVAPELLGCVLAHQGGQGLVAVEIVEVEAYTGQTDPASHAYRGRTARNAVMFGPPGHVYVYFTYGMHFCMNLVCRPPGEAAAVLIRAGRVVAGAQLAAARRAAAANGASGTSGSSGSSSGPAHTARREARLASGPARLCQALGIDRAQNGADVCDPRGELQVLTSAGSPGQPAMTVRSGPRVGVRAGAEAPWRFWIADDTAVSAYRAHAPRRRAGPQAETDVTRGPGDGSMQP